MQLARTDYTLNKVIILSQPNNKDKEHDMKSRLTIVVFLVFLVAPFTVGAAETSDFEVKTTTDLLNLCTTPLGGNLYA